MPLMIDKPRPRPSGLTLSPKDTNLDKSLSVMSFPEFSTNRIKLLLSFDKESSTFRIGLPFAVFETASWAPFLRRLSISSSNENGSARTRAVLSFELNEIFTFSISGSVASKFLIAFCVMRTRSVLT